MDLFTDDSFKEYSSYREETEEASDIGDSTYSLISKQTEKLENLPESQFEHIDFHLRSPEVSATSTPDLKSLFTTNPFHLLPDSPAQSAPSPPDPKSLQISSKSTDSSIPNSQISSSTPIPKPLQQYFSSELDLVYNILTSLSQCPTNCKPIPVQADLSLSLSHLTQECLISALQFFISLHHKYHSIQSSITKLKETKTRLLQSFAHSILIHLQKFESDLILNTDQLVAVCPGTQCKTPTLISLKACFVKYLEEFCVIIEIIGRVLAGVNEAYLCSELISVIFLYAEQNLFEFPFILKKLFFDCFSCYLMDLCSWMMEGFTSQESMIQKVFDKKFEWEMHSIKIIEIDCKSYSCVPIFLKKIAKKILAIGNYQFLFNKILNNLQFTEFYLEPSEQLHSRVMSSIKSYIEDHESIISLSFVINECFSKEVNKIFSNIGKKLFQIFNEKLNLMKIIKMLQKIFLLQDPKFLELFSPVLQTLRSKAKYENLSEEINNFFNNSEYQGFCHCEYLEKAESISQIKIKFHIPDELIFIFDESLEIYSKIFHFLLEIKMASGSIKTLNREYDWIKYRVQFIHFMNCFEFYSGQSTLCELLYSFNKIEMFEVYQVKKIHKKFISVLAKKLFLFGEYFEFYEKVRKIFDCFNQIFYLNLIGALFDYDEFYLQFMENFRVLLKVVEDNREIFFNEECKGYLDKIVDVMVGFNEFYKDGEGLRNG